MNININKDFEKEYKDDSWRDFPCRKYVASELPCLWRQLSVCGFITPIMFP